MLFVCVLTTFFKKWLKHIPSHQFPKFKVNSFAQRSYLINELSGFTENIGDDKMIALNTTKISHWPSAFQSKWILKTN